jgi:hypothetical protein
MSRLLSYVLVVDRAPHGPIGFICVNRFFTHVLYGRAFVHGSTHASYSFIVNRCLRSFLSCELIMPNSCDSIKSINQGPDASMSQQGIATLVKTSVRHAVLQDLVFAHTIFRLEYTASTIF